MARWTLAMLALGTAPAAWGAQAAAPQSATPQAATQPAAPPTSATEAEGEDEIVVTGRPLPGAVPGDIKPELQLSPADIRSYGASTTEELIEALEPVLASSRGRDAGPPIILIDGRRTSGFDEVRSLPPEAYLRIDILPEEVALRYGYRADQRVINFVLRPRFNSVRAETEGTLPTEGGSSAIEASAALFRINRGKRLTLNVEAETRSPLFESERDLIPLTTSRQFDTVGNVTAPTAGQAIDPLLTTRLGQPVSVAGVTTTGASPSLGDFAAAPNVTDTTPYRSLQGEQRRYAIDAVYSRTVLGDVAATATGRFERSDSRSFLGLPTATLALPGASPFSPFDNDVRVLRYVGTDPLIRDARSWSGNGALALNGNMGDWRWSLNGNYTRSESETETERGVDLTALQAAVTAGTASPFGDLGLLGRTVDTARSVNTNAAIDGLLAGPLFSLPAGEVRANVRAVGRTIDQNSRSVRGGNFQTTDIGRDSALLRANVDVPVASDTRDVLGFLGRLSLNGNAEYEQLSDFGGLWTLGYGFNWQPVNPLRILLSVTQEEGAPSPSQLGNPVITTPNVRVFDFVRGETVDINRIDGGNPGLGSDDRRVVKLGANLRPFSKANLSLRVDYTSSRTNNLVASFPAATAEIEAAFPDRFVRDGSGRLLQIDNRPVNFARADNEELTFGLNFGTRFETERSRREQAERRARQARFAERRAAREAGDAPPPPPGEGPGGPRSDNGPGGDTPRRFGGPGGGFGGGRGPGGGFGGGGGGGNIRVDLTHTWRLTNRLLIRPGLPELDLLDGSAQSSSGGQSRHEVRLNAQTNVDGYGGGVRVNWRGATSLDGGTTGGSSLRFGSFTTINLFFLADLGRQPELVRDHRWLRNVTVRLNFANLLNDRRRVTDELGFVPLSYQPGFVDPLGRTVSLRLRKLF